MLEITLNCQPDPQTLTQRVQIAMQEQKSLESLLDEASRGDRMSNPEKNQPTHGTRPERSHEAIAEITPIPPSQQLRPYGLYAGEFVVADDFDSALPEDIINVFEGK